MARTTAANFSGGLAFPYATSGTDLFKKEDVQVLAQAVDAHDHTTGKGALITTTPAAGSISNSQLGSDVARANLLTNGSFECWQRGNGPVTATGAYTADRWQIVLSGSDTVSVTRTGGEPPGQYAASCTVTHGTGNVFYQQVLKTLETQVLGKTVAASIRVWAPVAGATFILNRDGTGGGQATGTAHTGGNTWQTLTVSAAIPSDATQVTLAVVFSASGGFLVDNAMLVVGSQPSDYAPLHPADDLARCLRYYELSSDAVLATGFSTSTTVAEFAYRYLARKGGTPTITTAAASTFAMRTSGAGVTATAMSTFFAGPGAVLLNPAVASGLTTGQGVTLTGAAGAVQAEWNP